LTRALSRLGARHSHSSRVFPLQRSRGDYITVLFSFVEDNGLSLSNVLDAFRAPPLLLEAATSANVKNYVFHLAMCFDDLAVLLELVKKTDRSNPSANYEILSRAATCIPTALLAQVRAGGFVLSPGSDAVRTSSLMGLHGKVLAQAERDSLATLPALLSFGRATLSAPASAPSPSPPLPAAPPAPPGGRQPRQLAPAAPAPAVTANSTVHDPNYKCYYCGSPAHFSSTCPAPCKRSAADCRWKFCTTHRAASGRPAPSKAAKP
jgi:hypothetical protein